MAKSFDYGKNPLKQNPNLLGSRGQQGYFRAGPSSSEPPRKTMAVPKSKPKTMATPKTLPKTKPQRTKMGNRVEWIFR